MALFKSKSKPPIKPSCPFNKRCSSDSSVCGYIGYYAECPQTLKDRILTEVKEGVYGGVTLYDLWRRVRLNGKSTVG